METQSDAELIAAVIGGEETAFRFFYDRHVDAVFGRAMTQLNDEDDACEITQETFALAFRKLRSLRLVAGSAKPWLLRSCSNLAATRHRTAGRSAITVNIADYETLIAETDSLDAAWGFRILIQRLTAEVALMPFIDQEIYRLVLVEERPYQETAFALQISIASVRKRVNRVRVRLRLSVEGHCDE
jgi:RNA polymerase sigma factor (sigma-70 family)